DSIDSIQSALASAINALSTTMGAAAVGPTLTLTLSGAYGQLEAGKTGANGNRIGVYGFVSGVQSETWEPWFQNLAGGTSPSKWRVDWVFSNFVDIGGAAVPTQAVRKMRWTYAADLQASSFQPGEFEVIASAWQVTGTALGYKLAGPGSIRFESDSSSS